MIKGYHVIVAACFSMLAVISTRADDSVWTPYVGDTLYNQHREKVGVDTLNGKYVGLYFSASWCGPCRQFTPELQAFHKKFNSNFEVVLVGADRDEKSHFKYMTKYDMQWLSLPFGSDQANKLNQQFEVSGIPTLVLIDPQGKVITTDGRGAVMQAKPALAEKGQKLAVELETYKCGRCSQDHQRLALKAVQ